MKAVRFTKTRIIGVLLQAAPRPGAATGCAIGFEPKMPQWLFPAGVAAFCIF